MDTIPNAEGCDSITTYHISVGYTTRSVVTEYVCDSYTSPTGLVWTTDGTYVDTTINANHCDSIITYHLTFGYTTTNTVTESGICGSYTSPTTGIVWTMSGTYLDTITNLNGCDSITTYNLTIGHTTTETIALTACDNLNSPSSSTVWTTSGTYLDTTTNASGCANYITYNVTINYSKTTALTAQACYGYTLADGTKVTTSGVYPIVYTSAEGCDSTVTTTVTINGTTYATISPVVCLTYTSPAGQIKTASELFNDTLVNATGCDSVVTINLTVNTASYATRTIAQCDSYTVPETGSVYTTSGTYSDVSVNAAGCPFYITTVLTINTATAGALYIDGIDVVCPNLQVQYQWLDCNSGYSIVPGETREFYRPRQVGTYACVITTAQGCVDTSGCILFANSAIEENKITKEDINIYPNPANEFVVIDITKASFNGEVAIVLYDMTGKKVYATTIANTSEKTQINVSDLAEGVYTVFVNNELFSVTKKVIVSK